MNTVRVSRGASLALITVLSSTSLAQGQTPPDVVGVWSTSMTVRQDEAWQIEDYGCFLGCPTSAYEHLRSLVSDPANDERPFLELMVEAWMHAADRLDGLLTPEGRARRDELGLVDEDIRACQPLGFVSQILAPLPIEFSLIGDGIRLRYEEWHVVRTIYMDGRDHPEDLQPSRYGHSIGHYEGSTLVVETEGVAPGRFWVQHGGGGNSDQLRAVERYARSDDGRILSLRLTLEDPVMLSEPLVYEKVWRFTPNVELLEHSCETITGEP